MAEDLKDIQELDIPDPLEGQTGDAQASPASSGGNKKPKKQKPAKSDRKKKGSEKKSGDKKSGEKKGLFGGFGKKDRSRDGRVDVVRVEDLDDDIDVDEVLSMYMPRRRLKRLAAAIMRLDRLRLFLLLAILIVLILFLMSFCQEKMGNFTINLDRLELYRKGIAIASDGDFTDPTARLYARPVENATNIAESDLPTDIADVDGDHNGINYVAYTYYVRNAGKEDVSYVASIVMEQCSKGAEEAVRIAVWHNGTKLVYAKPSASGAAEDGCVNFLNNKLVCTYAEENFLVGNVDKYTVAIWMEGNDPECVDKIIGGSVQFSMNINAQGGEDTTLFSKFVQDIVDTLTGNDPISASGTESPVWESYRNVTWETRRNK